MAAGNYPDRLMWQVRNIEKDEIGQDVESFGDADTLWCRVDYTNGRRQKDYGATQTGAAVTIYIRNYPTVKALDRLTDGTTTFIIDNLRPGTDEIIADGNYYDTLVI